MLNFSTGCGKTLASIKVIQSIIDDDASRTGYIVCKESTHKKSWLADIDKHGFNHLLKNIKFILYASAKKIKKSDFYVLDECHALTPMKSAIFRDLVDNKTRVLYLSATIDSQKQYLIDRISRNTSKKYKITLVDAIRMGLLPEPEVVVHRRNLDDSNKRDHVFIMKRGAKAKQIVITCNYDDRWNNFNKHSNVEVKVMCNESEYYQLLSDQMDYYHTQSSDQRIPYLRREQHRNRFLNLGSQRKSFLAKIKTEKAKSLISEFRKNNNRFICFTGSIDQSAELGSVSSVHSKNKKDKNQELVDCFNREECSELFAVKMLREAVNLSNIQKGIIVQLDGSMGSFYQMLGRCLRHEFPEMHLLIIEDTKDEEYFASAVKDFDKKFIKYEN